MKQYRRIIPSKRGPIFLGNGDKSGSDAYDLTWKLHQALNIMSGLQQLGTYGISDEEKEKDFRTIKQYARDIYAALTGEEISPFIREFEDDKNS